MKRMAILFPHGTSFGIVQRGQIRVNIHILKVRWEFERGGSMCWLLAFVCEGRWGMNGSILQGADELDITIL